ncbi:hypothetical protein MJO29_002152 [Puccinia striiformis f. sp. tritici]|uniref:hypothetical protein n=1 Tax=Puccinia striiformis f. sp. tritici TaxID=168172 RepID=UPI002008A811|nr:hypothetical protein Pst134EA_002690 [Puccinia striiformis f. sp. tritici]KAH9472064.1 hypothetical protein Pst134EA_002690 [Puccinia striiformis f. sp. tritici]KAI7966404.1 hypothetical protein MJO29_002152 [Puccinia striiformis f. sp. tritici]KAI9618324.1 hypothetical protein KEM48_006777 [Puccinia striiformis f. sp. tritici PST-130]
MTTRKSNKDSLLPLSDPEAILRAGNAERAERRRRIAAQLVETAIHIPLPSSPTLQATILPSRTVTPTTSSPINELPSPFLKRSSMATSAHIFNDTKFFSQLELGNHDVIQTGKKDATLPIEGTGRVTLQWSTSTVLLDNCLYVPDIVINLISAGALLEKGCQIVAKKGSFTVSKEQQDLFKGSIDSNLFLVDNLYAII